MLPTTILITNKTNIAYFSHFRGTAGMVVLHKDKGFLLTDARYHVLAKKVLPSDFSLIDTTKGFDEAWQKILTRMKPDMIGYEGNHINVGLFERIKKLSNKIKLIDVTTSLDEMRMAKTEEEIRLIKKAQSITDQLFEILKKTIRAGMSEIDIGWEIRMRAHELGADDISFEPIVAINENAACPHHHPTHKKLKKGDRILIDMGIIYKGYCSDMTRMLFTKKPTSYEQKIYAIVWTAQQEGIKAIKSGIKGSDVDAVARKIIEQAGFGNYFTHSLGHGIGLDVHELPTLSHRYKQVLPEHSVVTVEPGIYIEGSIGIRLEDMVIVGENRAVNITKSAKDLESNTIRLR